MKFLVIINLLNITFLLLLTVIMIEKKVQEAILDVDFFYILWALMGLAISSYLVFITAFCVIAEINIIRPGNLMI